MGPSAAPMRAHPGRGGQVENVCAMRKARRAFRILRPAHAQRQVRQVSARAAFKIELKELGVRRPQSSGKGQFLDTKPFVDAWRQDLEKVKHEYLAREANSQSQLGAPGAPQESATAPTDVETKSKTRIGPTDIPVKYKDGQWEYLPPGTIMRKRGMGDRRWALRLCRGQNMLLPDGTSVHVMTWEKEALALRKQMDEWAERITRAIREEQEDRAMEKAAAP